ILSAMFLFIPLLAPIADRMGIDPMHFGIIFIVNLEIGYLTPPVGLNLFVASTLFEKPLGHMVRSVFPFIALMTGGLVLITFVPEISVGLGSWILGEESGPTAPPHEPLDGDEFPDELPDELPDETPDTPDGVQSIEEMMRELDEGGGEADDGDGHVQTIEEMMRELDEGADDEEGDEAPPEEAPPEEAPPEDDGHVQSMEEMMNEAGLE
ncbi:MAG: TRAP transporter large permease subunit, partial [Myxococcales bacterium]|nr:TRAP transporter large permease subunit [Myxococcales bacterium]